MLIMAVGQKGEQHTETTELKIHLHNSLGIRIMASEDPPSLQLPP